MHVTTDGIVLYIHSHLVLLHFAPIGISFPLLCVWCKWRVWIGLVSILSHAF